MSSAAVLVSWRQASVAQEAAAAVRAAERYEEARYLALVQHVQHEDALAHAEDEDGRSAHRNAAARFSAVLDGLRSVEVDNPTQLLAVISDQERYLTLTDQFFTLAAAGRHDEAQTLHDQDIEPIEQLVMARVDEMAATNRALSVSAHAHLQRQANALKIGTPVSLAAGLVLVWMFSRVTSSYRRTVEFQAAHDVLTGLPNRALFHRRCEQALSGGRGASTQPAVLLLDLNGFKQVNDTLGHHIGDHLLTQVADRLRRSCRASLARPIVVDDVTLDVVASIGIAMTEAGMNMDTLLRRADTAMYRSKRHRTDWAVYSPDEDGARTGYVTTPAVGPPAA